MPIVLKQTDAVTESTKTREHQLNQNDNKFNYQTTIQNSINLINC